MNLVIFSQCRCVLSRSLVVAGLIVTRDLSWSRQVGLAAVTQRYCSLDNANEVFPMAMPVHSYSDCHAIGAVILISSSLIIPISA